MPIRIFGSHGVVNLTTPEEILKLWLSDYIEPRIQTSSLKRSTFIRYEGILNNYLLPHFGKCNLVSITPSMIQKFLSGNIKEGELGNGSLRTILIVLNTIFARAIKFGYLKQNPAKEIERPKLENKETYILTPQEIR
ncbi:MAG TPA: N-terminal phage integrase SAM-like domain-containing protein [Candidatus Aquicultor sp.]